MRYYRKILRISFKDHATDEEVCAKIQRAIGPRRPPDHRKETQTAVVWTYLPYIRSGQNYLARHSERRQGRQRKRWEDNTREWTGLEFATSQRAVENGEKWRELDVKSSVVPQRPPRLRDR